MPLIESNMVRPQGFPAGEYKTILRLVGILPYGKIAKRLCDRAIDSVDGVQNLRKAIYRSVRFYCHPATADYEDVLATKSRQIPWREVPRGSGTCSTLVAIIYTGELTWLVTPSGDLCV